MIKKILRDAKSGRPWLEAMSCGAFHANREERQVLRLRLGKAFGLKEASRLAFAQDDVAVKGYRSLNLVSAHGDHERGLLICR